MKEFKVGERFIIPDGDDGYFIEVQERDRHSLCDGCFFNDFTCINMSPMGDYDVLESECKGNHLYDYIISVQ